QNRWREGVRVTRLLNDKLLDPRPVFEQGIPLDEGWLAIVENAGAGADHRPATVRRIGKRKTGGHVAEHRPRHMGLEFMPQAQGKGEVRPHAELVFDESRELVLCEGDPGVSLVHRIFKRLAGGVIGQVREAEGASKIRGVESVQEPRSDVSSKAYRMPSTDHAGDVLDVNYLLPIVRGDLRAACIEKPVHDDRGPVGNAVRALGLAFEGKTGLIQEIVRNG